MHNVAHVKFNKTQLEPLYDSFDSHSNRVYMEGFRNPFIDYCGGMWKYVAYLHDYGKASKEFYDRIMDNNTDPDVDKDHSSAGVQLLFQQDGLDMFSKLVASHAIHAHHIGLQDTTGGSNPEYSLREAIYKTVNRITWEPNDVDRLEYASGGFEQTSDKLDDVFRTQLYTRLLTSTLVQADHSATSKYYKPNKPSPRLSWDYLERVLDSYESRLLSNNNEISDCRKELFNICGKKATGTPNHMELEAPTGIGKTLSSLKYAIRKAKLCGNDKIIYVIPFNAITEQFTKTFQEIFDGCDDLILNHYCTFDTSGTDDTQHRSRVNNWDSQIIITTQVQFFESFFACPTNRLKRISSVVNSTIIVDEIQSISSSHMYPSFKLLNCLTTDFGCNVLTMSATHFDIPPNIGVTQVKSMLSKKDTKRFFKVFDKRVVYVVGKGLDLTDDIIREVKGIKNESVLVITNKKLTCTDIYRGLKCPDTYMLSTNLSANHRKSVLGVVRSRLDRGDKIRLVSTCLIEAGVDISFDRVYREYIGLDSVLQAAGRCNRHGLVKQGKVVLFSTENTKKVENALFCMYKDLKDWCSSKTVKEFFRRKFSTFNKVECGEMGNFKMGKTEFDECFLDDGRFQFQSYEFKLIPDDSFNIFTPYGNNHTAQHIEKEFSEGRGFDYQEFIVSDYEYKKDDLIANNIIYELTEDVYMLVSNSSYDSGVGLSVEHNEHKEYDIY